MSHRNARLTAAGRKILVDRVFSGRPVAHVAAEMGISRQCAHRWVNRYREHGVDGLEDRTRVAYSRPQRTPAAVEAAVVRHRTTDREGPAELSRRTGAHPRTVSRIIARAGLPHLWQLDPVTGEQTRSSQRSNNRYERDAPGDMIHVDVKKLGRIPDGGGWRADPGQDRAVHRTGHQRTGYDYIHAAVDDHSRLAYAEVLPDEKGPTCASFLHRAADYFAGCGFTVKRVMTDNALAHRHSNDFQTALRDLAAKHILTKPHCPWQNGKVERFNRTLAAGWAYNRPYTSNQDRTDALPAWLAFYNNRRQHTSIGGPPINRCHQPAV